MGGAKRRKIISRMWKNQDGKCYFCKCETVFRDNSDGVMMPNTPTIEHLIPVSNGGKDLASNLRMSCYQCNSTRSSICAIEWTKIVNDPKKLAAMKRVRKLKKKLKKIYYLRKNRDRLLNKYGIFVQTHRVPQEIFERLFGKR